MPRKPQPSKFRLTQKELDKTKQNIGKKHSDIFWEIGQRVLVDRETPSGVANDLECTRQYINNVIREIVLAYYGNTPTWFVYRRFRLKNNAKENHAVLVNADSRNEAIKNALDMPLPEYLQKDFLKWLNSTNWQTKKIEDRYPPLSLDEYEEALEKTPKNFKPKHPEKLKSIVTESIPITDYFSAYTMDYASMRSDVQTLYLYHYFTSPKWAVERTFWTTNKGIHAEADTVTIDARSAEIARDRAFSLPVSEQHINVFRKWTSKRRWVINMVK